MIYTLKSKGPKIEFDMRGRLTFADYSSFREITNMVTDNNSKCCLFDLSELEFIDSAGLGMLLIARDKLKSVNGNVILKGAQGQVKKMLDLGRFDSLFNIE